MRYPRRKEGEWIHIIRNHKIMCCDCGLVHRLEFRIVSKRRIIFRAFRDERATAASGARRDNVTIIAARHLQSRIRKAVKRELSKGT